MEKKGSGLIIFVKNPVAGKVKTRLGATVGNERALEVYINLMQHTRKVALESPVDRHLFYDKKISTDDLWSNHDFLKDVQVQGDLGQRMESAFISVLNKNNKAVIIGSDCPEISPEIIATAFNRLDLADVVIGPTYDGGYYLLGMKEVHAELFRDMTWSTDSVYTETLARIKKKGLLYTVCPTLSDMDNEDDLKKFPQFGTS